MNKNIYIVSAFAFIFAMAGLPTTMVHAQGTTMGIEGTDAVTAASVTSAPVAPTATSAQQAQSLEQAKQQVEKAREQAKQYQMLIQNAHDQAKQQVELLSEQAKQKIEQARTTVQEARGLASSSDVTALKEQAKQQVEQVREQSKQQTEKVREQAKQQVEQAKQQIEQVREVLKNSIELIRESTTTPAQSIGQLKQLIEERKATIQNEAASTTADTRKILEDVAPMRVAVHALLASRDLLGEKGGIGQQVSDIAQQMNDSVATTTNAEAKIQTRGFFSKLFFGGDKNAADAITQQVAQNQTHLQTLAGLIASASTTAEVKTTLDAQVQAMTAEQSRLKDVAQSQSKLWGLFSWRLF